jgi:hypothetical protein
LYYIDIFDLTYNLSLRDNQVCFKINSSCYLPPLPEQAYKPLPGARKPLLFVTPAITIFAFPAAGCQRLLSQLAQVRVGKRIMAEKHFKPLMEQVRAAG